MKFLVLGATGTVGSQVTRELLARGQQVRALTRDPQKAKALGEVDVAKGDLLDPSSLKGIFDGVDGMFLLNAVVQEEATEGIVAASFAKTAGIKRIIHMSVQHADRGAYLPHFGGKLGVEEAVKLSAPSWTILRPSNFHQNDIWYQQALLEYGVYPQPVGDKGVSRVDVRDIAEVAARALIEGGLDGRTIDVVGPEAMTGTRMAEVWSAALGKPVAYAGNDLEAWEQQAKTYLPGWMVYDFKLMYAHFQANGLRATDAEVAELTKILGHPPRPMDAFTQETARAWSSATTS